MPTVTLMTGLPGCGKSTQAMAMLAESGARLRRVNLDDLRMMLDANDGTVRHGREHEAVVLAAQDAAILAAVDAGFDVVVDNTHLVPRLPARYRRLLATRDVQFELVDLTGVPVEECIRRDAARARSVGEDVITAMWTRHRAARASGWRLSTQWLNDARVAVEPYRPGVGLEPAVLCDIDGTLAIHADRGPYDLEQCESDLLNEEVARILALCDRAEDYIVLLSGRQSEYRAHTERWLAKHQVVYDELWMRPAGDRRGDDQVKAELFDAHVRHRFNVRFVLDDRDRLVALWRRMGLPCWQVNYGNF